MLATRVARYRRSKPYQTKLAFAFLKYTQHARPVFSLSPHLFPFHLNVQPATQSKKPYPTLPTPNPHLHSPPESILKSHQCHPLTTHANISYRTTNPTGSHRASGETPPPAPRRAGPGLPPPPGAPKGGSSALVQSICVRVCWWKWGRGAWVGLVVRRRARRG